MTLKNLKRRVLNVQEILSFQTHNGVYYCQIKLPDGSLSVNKSTGCYNKREAEEVAMRWYITGKMPVRTNGKNKEETTTDFLSILNSVRTYDFSQDEVKEILNALKQREYVQSAVLVKSIQAKPIEEYLENFWNAETSPYVREKKLKGQAIHSKYISNNQSYIGKYWIPRLAGKAVGEITREDINAIFEDDMVMKLAPKTINQIVGSITIPMKYAYFHNLTEKNCYDGIIKCSNKTKERKILSLEETKALFEADWENDMAKLACAISCYTGMRRGEVAALRLQDIGEDRIYIRHSWNPTDKLKSTKTGEEREMLIPPLLRNMLLAQAEMNPYGEGAEAFIFFGLVPGQPTDPANWLKYMRRALESLGYKNAKEITFQSFRHEWCTTALTEIGDKRICMIGSGHKTDSVFANYAKHIQKEEALKRIAFAAEKVFLPVVQSIEKVEYKVLDEEEEVAFETEVV